MCLSLCLSVVLCLCVVLCVCVFPCLCHGVCPPPPIHPISWSNYSWQVQDMALERGRCERAREKRKRISACIIPSASPALRSRACALCVYPCGTSACVRACVRACMKACVRVCACVFVCVCLCASGVVWAATGSDYLRLVHDVAKGVVRRDYFACLGRLLLDLVQRTTVTGSGLWRGIQDGTGCCEVARHARAGIGHACSAAAATPATEWQGNGMAGSQLAVTGSSDTRCGRT